jgi:hypothetical protein
VASFFKDAVIEKQMRNNAMLISQIVHESRRLYSDEVVDRVKPLNEVQVSNRYTDFTHGIPNPATFTILLAERLSDWETRIHM